jgi:hypothetical protein
MKAVVALTLITLLAFSIIQTTQALIPRELYDNLTNIFTTKLINDVCNNPDPQVNQKCEHLKELVNGLKNELSLKNPYN